MPFVGDMPENAGSNNNTEQNSASVNSNIDKQVLEYLKQLNDTLNYIAKNSKRMSQSDAQFEMPRRDDFRSRAKDYQATNKKKPFRSTGNASDDFMDSFEDVILESFLGSSFKRDLSAVFGNMAKVIGEEVRDIPGALGRELGQRAFNVFSGTDFGKKFTEKVAGYKDKATSTIKDTFLKGVRDYDKATGNVGANSYENKFRHAFKSQSAAQEETTRAEDTDQDKSDVTNESASNLSSSIKYDKLIITEAVIETAIIKNKLSGKKATEYIDKKDKEKADAEQKAKEAAEEAAKRAAESSSNTQANAQPLEDLTDNGNADLSNVLDFNNTKFGDMLNKFKGTKIGSKLSGLAGKVPDMLGKIPGVGKFAGGAAKILGTSASTMTTAGVAAGSTATGVGALASGAMSGLAALGPYAAAAAVAILAVKHGLNKLKEAIGPAVEGFKQFKESASSAMNRYANSRKEYQKLEKKRLADDINDMLKEPFNILKDAAQKVYDSWDSNLRTINQTQGYNKSDLQDLYSSYAQRLKSEGLTEVISSADIISSLSNVLTSGLSGKVAEEFSYLATKLNAAIPTQDFFGYADVYASLAAQAIQQGKSESEAIAYANSQMETFASNILYASRQLSGGFTTGLKDAQELFKDSVNIAAAAHTNNASDISGVLTSISAVVGGIAPDLTSGIVDAVVKAATGGNSSEIVALRSLAGINAGNTEFLRQMATDPQGVFTTIFNNLAQMQNMNTDNYMEVAEGLSEVFGISMEAFQRVDFNYLADAISKMSVSNNSLEENLKLLASGESTTSAEQQRMAQINKYMLDEGLAYVLDNNVARSIQEHMWEEQIAQEMMEATYGVELAGGTLALFEGIAQTIQNILDFLNPFSFLKKLGNLVATADQSRGLQSDLRKVLELGKVGSGNARELYNLTTRGIDLNLTPSLVELMGGSSSYSAARAGTNIFNALTNPVTSLWDIYQSGTSASMALLNNLTSGGTSSGPTSSYVWTTVGKSFAKQLASTNFGASGMSTISQLNSANGAVQGQTSSEKAQADAINKLNKLIDENYIQGYVRDEKTADEWLASAKSLGISNLDATLQAAGYTRDQLEQRYQQAQITEASKMENERKKKEEEFWDRSNQYFDYMQAEWTIDTTSKLQEQTDLLTTQNDLITELTQLMVTNLGKIYTKADSFYNEWMKYFVYHKYYDSTTGYDASAVSKLKDMKDAEQSDAVYKLADVLTAAGLDLRDPQMQANALLAEILIVTNKLLQAQDKTSNGGLVETLQGLALGLTK